MISAGAGTPIGRQTLIAAEFDFPPEVSSYKLLMDVIVLPDVSAKRKPLTPTFNVPGKYWIPDDEDVFAVSATVLVPVPRAIVTVVGEQLCPPAIVTEVDDMLTTDGIADDKSMFAVLPIGTTSLRLPSSSVP